MPVELSGAYASATVMIDDESLLGQSAREQIQTKAGRLPDSVVACAGGGSNTMGAFHRFVSDEDVDLFAVEAGGSSLAVDEEEGIAPNSASLSTGNEGILHGARTKLLQDSDGQIMESHSVSAGLDYSGVGPELAHLVDEGRVTPVNVDDDTALEAFHRLSQDEGIIPALETAHAFGFLEENPDKVGDLTIVNVSGRGDKDLETVIEETAKRDLDIAPEMSVFEQAGAGRLGSRGEHE